jgi:hypothetical protein
MSIRIGALALIAVLSLSALVALPAGAAPQTVSLVRVEIDQDLLSLDVSPTGNSTALLTGRVYLPYPKLLDSADVFLTQDIPDYSGLLLSQNEFTLTPEEPEATFHGNLTVPPSLSSSLRGAVSIGGSATVQPGGTSVKIEADSTDVEILPYYGAALYFQKVFGKIDPDGTETFILQVNNTGNADDTFTLSLVDPAPLREGGIAVELENAQAVPEGGSAQVQVTVKAHDAERGTYIVRIEARSEGKGGSEPEDSVGMLTITVEERVISFLQGSPYTLVGAIAGAVLLIALISVGASQYLKRRRWRRQFQSMVETAEMENREFTPPPPRTPPRPPGH